MKIRENEDKILYCLSILDDVLLSVGTSCEQEGQNWSDEVLQGPAVLLSGTERVH